MLWINIKSNRVVCSVAMLIVLGCYLLGAFWDLTLNTAIYETLHRLSKNDSLYLVSSSPQTNPEKQNVSLKTITALSFSHMWFPVRASNGLDCKELFKASSQEQSLAMNSSVRAPLTPQMYMTLTKNCTVFKQTRRYILQPLSDEEAQFSIAYSIIMYKDIEQSERLLRAIYRPQNYYCIHADLKSSILLRRAMKSIASCFPNVFMASREYRVYWGSYSVIEPELRCMEDLWKYTEWRLLRRRFRRKYNQMYNFTFTYGSVHVVVQRGFVDFLLHSKPAISLRNYLKGTWVPDETLFTTLNYSPQLGVPGSYKGEPESEAADVFNGTYPRNPFLARFKNWRDRNHPRFRWHCAGRIVREICIFGVGDLPLLASRPELFANKFHATYQQPAYDCLEERHFNNTRDQLLAGYQFNDTYYRNLEFIHNVVR